MFFLFEMTTKKRISAAASASHTGFFLCSTKLRKWRSGLCVEKMDCLIDRTKGTKSGSLGRVDELTQV